MKRTIWVTRDLYTDEKADCVPYNFSALKKDQTKVPDGVGDVFWRGGEELCAPSVHELTGIRLEPGEGPVKFTLTLERA